MPGIEVATDALQIQFFLVFFIVKMRGDPCIGNPCGKQVLMTLLTRFVRDIFHGMFELRLHFPIECIFCQVAPRIAYAKLYLGRIMIPCLILWRQVAVDTMNGDTAAVVYVRR